MLHVLDKASRTTTERARAEALLERETALIRMGFLGYVNSASTMPGANELLAFGDVESVLAGLDRYISMFAAVPGRAFVDAANAETKALASKLTMKAKRPALSLLFDPGDPRAARLMQRNKLQLITGLTRQARESVRRALVAGLQQGLGPRAIARMFRNAIGLTAQQLQHLTIFERGQRQLRTDDLELPEAERPPIFNDEHINRIVDRQADHLVRVRAEAIARTESLRVVGQARDQALRQALETTGQSAQLTGKEWHSHRDARTRDDHANANGQRRRLDDAFDVGGEQLMQPGDGSARQSVNCRCVVTHEFFDGEAELQTWLGGGT